MALDIIFLIICTALQALISTIISIAIALPCSFTLHYFTIPGNSLWLGLALIIANLPTKIVALAIMWGFGVQGFLAIIMAHCFMNIPFAFYTLHSSLQKIDYTWELAARSLGANDWQFQKTIILPFLKPTLITTSIAIFLLCFSSSLPLTLGTDSYHFTPDIMISNYYNQGQTNNAWLYWLARLSVVFAIIIMHYCSTNNSFFRDSHWNINLPRQFFRKKWWFLFGLLLMLLLFFGIPCFMLIKQLCAKTTLTFFYNLIFCIVDPLLNTQVYRIIGNSLYIACASSFGAVCLGFLLCLIEHNKLIGKAIVLCLLQIIPIIGSVGCGIFFEQLSYFFGQTSMSAIVLSHLFLNYAYTYRIIKTQWDIYHPDMYKAAAQYGANCWHQWKTISLPLLWPVLLNAFCMAFSLSLVETGASLSIKNNISMTIPVASKIYIKHGLLHHALCLNIIIGICTLIIFVACNYCNRFSTKSTS